MTGSGIHSRYCHGKTPFQCSQARGAFSAIPTSPGKLNKLFTRDPSKAGLKVHHWESFMTQRENIFALVCQFSYTQLISSVTKTNGRHCRRAQERRGSCFALTLRQKSIHFPLLALESQENDSVWMAYKCSAFGSDPDRESIHPSIVLTSHLLLHQGRGTGTWFRGHAPYLKDRGNAYGNTCYSSASWNRCFMRGWKAGECRVRPGGRGVQGGRCYMLP